MIGGIDPYLLAGIEEIFSALQAGVNDSVLLVAVFKPGKSDGLQIGIGIQDKKERIITQLRFLFSSVELKAQGPQFRVVPRRFFKVFSKPGQVRDGIRVKILSEEEFSSLKDGASFFKGDRLFEKIEDIRIFINLLPQKPADLVVLAIGIVIPSLCPHEFIAAEDHRRPA
jgi:hypothetical protein